MSENGQPVEQGDAAVPQPGLKFLETAVYVMGGLLVLMLLGLIGGILWKITHKTEVPPVEAKLMELGLPANTPISQMTLDGDRLALNAGTEIIVVDVRKGQVISRIAVGRR